MTYDEMAEALGITPDSARRLAARNKHWPRRPGNDGRTRVGVPADRIPDKPPVSTPDDSQDDRQDDSPEARDDVTLIVSVLTQHIERLEKDLASVKEERKAERDRLEERAGALEGKIETLEQDLAAERLITAQVGALKEMLETARQRGDELKAERDRWVELVETNQRRIDELSAKRLGWWPFRKRA
jgi:peptidoglycan hydrolase CwlO-like protein